MWFNSTHSLFLPSFCFFAVKHQRPKFTATSLTLERLSGQVLTTRRYTNLRLPLPSPLPHTIAYSNVVLRRSYLVESVKSSLGSKQSWFSLGEFDGADFLFLTDVLCDHCNFLLFVVGKRLFLRDFLLLGTDHGNQLVGVFVLDRKLFLLSCKFSLEIVDLNEHMLSLHPLPQQHRPNTSETKKHIWRTSFEQFHAEVTKPLLCSRPP